MQAHEERVVAEKKELDDKVTRLKVFCIDPGNQIYLTLPKIERELLRDQYFVMLEYSKLLGRRIARFPLPSSQ